MRAPNGPTFKQYAFRFVQERDREQDSMRNQNNVRFFPQAMDARAKQDETCLKVTHFLQTHGIVSLRMRRLRYATVVRTNYLCGSRVRDEKKIPSTDSELGIPTAFILVLHRQKQY